MRLHEKTVLRVRVACQRTFSKSKISLIAEESVEDVVKGSVVATVSPAKLQEIKRDCAAQNVPLSLLYSKCKKGGKR